jgi:signal transduction histidine kinase
MKRLLTVLIICCCIYSYSQTREQDSIAVALAYQTQDSLKVDTSISLIKSLYKTKNYKKALQYINQTEKLATQLNYKKRLAQVHYYKALIFASKDDYYNSINSYERSKHFYSILNDSLGIAKANNNIGLIEIKRGNYNKGLQYSLSAIKIFEAKNLKNDLSTAYNNLADAYYNTGRIDKSLEFNKKALIVRNQISDSYGIKTSTLNIANLYSEKKESRKAIEYYQKALDLLGNEDAIVKGNILPKIGEEYLYFKEYKKSADYLVRGLKLNRKLKNKQGIVKSLNALGLLNFEKNKLKLSQSQLDEALSLLKNVKNDKELVKNYKYRMRLDSALGKFKNAYYWQNKYYRLQNKLDKKKLPKTDFIDDPIETIKAVPIAITNNITPKESIVNNKTLTNLKYIAYGLGAALLAILSIMLYMFSKRKAQIKRNKTLKKKNKEILKENKEILEKTVHLEETNNVKDRLFSIVSHDLKDSVSSIKGCMDLLKEGSLTNEEFQNIIPELSENADNASQLLFDLLNWSKTQMQNLEPKLESFNIQEVFKSKIHLFEKKLEQKRVVLIDESKPESVYADKNMVEIVIQNLIANAIKFSSVGDVITVSNRQRNGNILICIEDTGVGISEENQKRIFASEAFTTLGTDNEKGTGLGLSICKELVELNNGRIWVQSEKNFGSKFFIELPRHK